MTDVISHILNRSSEPRLESPAPDQSVLSTVFECAARAPDHALLRPWRYLVIEGEGLDALGQVFARTADASNPTALPKEKLLGMTHRAPMIIVGIARHHSHPKVPPIEESLSAGCGMAYILLALEAQGFAGMWRTGSIAYNPVVTEGLGLAANESVVGFLYVGTPISAKPMFDRPDPDEFVSRWPG